MQVAVNLEQYRDIERNFDEGCCSNIYKNHNATADESLKNKVEDAWSGITINRKLNISV